MFLDLNAAALRAQGLDLAYPSRDGAAGGKLKLFLPAPTHTQEAVEWRAGKASYNLSRHVTDPARRLVLSEENLLGGLDPLTNGRFYPFCAMRARFLARVLKGRPVGRVLLVVRPYDRMFVSAFCKLSEGKVMPDFNEKREDMAAFEGDGWPEVALTLIRELAPRKLVILPYQRPRREVDLARALVPGLQTEGLQEPAHPVNASLPDAALIELQKRYAAGETPQRALVEQLRTDYADAAPPHPYAAFTPEQKVALRARYKADLETLRLLMGVQVLDPEEASG
ncbi:MAG: hypothetical protein CSA73_01065 [Rhodobacterales bacterium]|nr:MAG: hypothetical protein CSA73_01065 [Rhodobacterales bacterium]